VAKDRVLLDIGPKEQFQNWSDIDWQTAEKSVKNLRQRIYRATQEAQWNKVRSLMKLMLRSYSNLLLSVRRVTQENQGRKTAGVDRQLILTPKARITLAQNMLEHTLWKARPVKRVYIPKAGGKRPLGIPTIKNRVAQAVVKNALEPSWEARFEPNSYGFRPGRSCHDAIEQCWNRLRKHCKDKWILDADIKGAFDNINHNYLLKAIGNIPGRELIKHWLKAGHIEAEIFHHTNSGVPQGGIISPLLANIALNGMEQLLIGRANIIRYADDFVVTARSKTEIEAVKPTIEKWLAERGLAMHPDKTKIVSIDQGFNFLGFTVKHYKGKCLIKPQKEKVLKLLRDIRQWLHRHRQLEAEHVIRHLNPILIGWANYYRHAVSKDIFAYVSHEVWKALWRWSLKRHRTKGKDWVLRKYFSPDNKRGWKFYAKTNTSNGKRKVLYLVSISYISIVRHIKVKGTASPDDPSLTGYWNMRKIQRKEKLTKAFRSESPLCELIANG
jgi:RNA-directed DNA polymerase